MGPTWVLSAPDGPHVGPMNLAIRAGMVYRHFHFIISSIHLQCILSHCCIIVAAMGFLLYAINVFTRVKSVYRCNTPIVIYKSILFLKSHFTNGTLLVILFPRQIRFVLMPCPTFPLLHLLVQNKTQQTKLINKILKHIATRFPKEIR